MLSVSEMAKDDFYGMEYNLVTTGKSAGDLVKTQSSKIAALSKLSQRSNTWNKPLGSDLVTESATHYFRALCNSVWFVFLYELPAYNDWIDYIGSSNKDTFVKQSKQFHK